MPKTSYICNCDVIHEDIVNDVKSKIDRKSTRLNSSHCG